MKIKAGLATLVCKVCRKEYKRFDKAHLHDVREHKGTAGFSTVITKPLSEFMQ
jgi:hypothetical protein